MFRRRFSEETGAVAVTFAIVFLVIVGVAALAVDVGFWYTARRQLQSAADAAALAGCRELSEGSGATAIEDAVDELANDNFTTPLDAEPTSRVSETEVGDDYVKVTCETDAPVFLAHWLLNSGTTLIRAQSVAKVGYLGGARAPVPFGLTILQIGSLSGRLGDGEYLAFSEDADGYWERTFPVGSNGELDLQATNSQSFTETFEDLVSVGALVPGGRIVAMDVDSTTLTEPDPGVHVTVDLSGVLGAGERLQAEAGAAKVDLVLQASGDYEADVPVAYPAKMHPAERATLTVTLGDKKAAETVECVLLLRPSSYLFQDVQAHPAAVLPGDAVKVRVKTLEFEYNTQYELKVEGGESITQGSFGALNFTSLDHSECGYPDTPPPPGGAGADSYETFIIGDVEFVMHINDMVDVEPGNMAQKTAKGIAERLQGVELLTLAEWEAADRPNTKQVAIVPIVERMQEVLGRKPVRVVGFATFLIEEPLPGHKDPVVGTFVEWTAPGWVVVDDPPGGGLVIEAVHLTDEHLDF